MYNNNPHKNDIKTLTDVKIDNIQEGQVLIFEDGYFVNKDIDIVSDGAQGKDGKSAYEIALENGFVGTEEEWLESLKGQDGQKGEKGEQGESGVYVGDKDTAPYSAFIVIDNSEAGMYSNDIITVPIIDSTLTLTMNKYQTTTMEDNTTIVLPTVDKYTEIHLFFDTTSELTLILPAIKWQGDINIEANKTYEFIFTYTDKWLGGCVAYE